MSEHSPELRHFQCEMARQMAATQPKIFARERAALARAIRRALRAAATRSGMVFGTKPGLAKGRRSAADAQDGRLSLVVGQGASELGGGR